MSLLAQIIAGEAAQNGDSSGDSFGVASTIYNRTQDPAFASYGSTALSQATGQAQFSAYPNGLKTPTAYQQQLADAAENGTLSNYGNTGNATYYNAPGFNSAYSSAYKATGANGYDGASNQYSDVYNGQPSPGFILPQQGASGAPATAGDTADSTETTNFGAQSYDGNSGLSSGSDAFGNGGAGASSISGDAGGSDPANAATGFSGQAFIDTGGFGASNNPATPGYDYTPSSTGQGYVTGQTLGSNPTGGTIDTASLGGSGNSVDGGATSIPGVSSQGTGNFLDTSSSPSSNATSDSAPQPASVPGVTAAPNSVAAPTAANAGNGAQGQGGTPTTITDASLVGQQAGTAVAKGLSQDAGALTTAEGNLAAAGTSWLGSIFSGETSILVRGGFILLGLVVLLGAFLFFYIDSKEGNSGGNVTVVPIPV